jgi:hypothetical protein
VTEAQRHAAIIALIDEHTRKNTVSKAAARADLIRSGIYTQKGQLRVEFGGPGSKRKSAAAA